MEEPKVNLVVSGMTCTNCAMTVKKAIEKSGASNVNVNYLTGDVSFTEIKNEKVPEVVQAINQLGYAVESTSLSGTDAVMEHGNHSHHGSTIQKRLIVSAIFSIPLLFHMFLPFSFLHHPLIQFLLCLPVMYIGVIQFGKSAFYSLKSGVPNMDVLIILGSGAAFIYSVAGIFVEGGQHAAHYLFFETAATIITLVLLGNFIEERSVKQTTGAIAELKKLQPEEANKVLADGKTETVEVKSLQVSDIVLVNTGDRIPLDGKIIYGNAVINESMLTGESIPVQKGIGEEVTGGTLINSGSAQIVIEKTGSATTLAKIIQLVKDAQNQRPKIQKLGDKVSAIFVPVVVGISLLTFLIAFFGFHFSLQKALMQSIAVLVISCPCAMGLATPTAVMAGLGRAAKKGILIKGGATLEELSKIKIFVFDKTGTLTTGNFRIEKIHSDPELLPEIKRILFSIEQFSSHPIAKSLVKELKAENYTPLLFTRVDEDKGIGLNATDEKGNLYSVGSYRMVQHLTKDTNHDVYVLKNNILLAEIDILDELKPDTANVIHQLQAKGIRTILLSGDRKIITERVAKSAGIAEVYSEKHPAEKLQVLETLLREGPVAMIGDGVNDAPALAKATVGISISDATDTAMQSSQIILLARHNLSILLPALRIGALTYSTIRQNLFWAFFYNVIAIPIAAAGFLNPMVAALSMAFSDVVVIGNSLRLKTRKIE